MLAYVRLVQSREKELGVDVLTHQKWSGAPYLDGILGSIQSGSSSSKSMGEGNTETGMFNLGRFAFEGINSNEIQGSERYQMIVMLSLGKKMIPIPLCIYKKRRYCWNTLKG